MNKRQRKKRFKKMYGMNPNKAVKAICQVDWSDLVKSIADKVIECMAECLEICREAFGEMKHEDTEKAINGTAEEVDLRDPHV